MLLGSYRWRIDPCRFHWPWVTLKGEMRGVIFQEIRRNNKCELFLRFNSHFPDEPGLAGVYWSEGWWKWWWQLDYWSYKSCKAPVKSSPPTNYIQFFTGRMPFLSPNQQCQSTEGKNITFHRLAYPKLTWGLWPLIAPGYLGKGFHASHQPSDAIPQN